jgi:hypothetical protein
VRDARAHGWDGDADYAERSELILQETRPCSYFWQPQDPFLARFRECGMLPEYFMK